MPPNRQSVAAVLRCLSAEDLSGFVTRSKYAPLTAGEREPKAAAAAIEEQQAVESYWDEAEAEHVEESDADADADAYWGWPSLSSRQDAQLDLAEADDAAAQEAAEWDAEVARRRAVVASVLAEEEVRRVVSAEHMAAKLVEEGRRRDEASSCVEVVRSERAEEAGYWDWDAETDLHDSAPVAVSAARMEELLEKEAIRIKVHSHSPSVKGSCQEEYWAWETLAPEEQKRRLVLRMLEEESARQLVCAAHMEARLRQSRSSRGPVVRSGEVTDAYWSWDSVADHVHAAHTKDATHPKNAYWDWSSPVSADEAKAVLLRRILADEEARRAVSVRFVEESLRAQACSSGDERIGSDEKEEEGYWDM